ncbi:MAG TPA: glycoside hydrolase family 65, partial [Blastocatellia bacterium]|nr:glycoside hydrolase family 65 [Blastocatellia bacterium]
MKQSRRNFLRALAASGGLLHVQASERPTAFTPSLAPIDRAALVRRHNPVLRQIDQLSPLSVGNGEFAFTADVTGLQTFPDVYEQAMPLCTLSQWGWHSAPLPVGSQKALRLVQFDTFGRQVGYAVSSDGQNEAYNWLRENPHRLHLGRVALRLMTSGGREAQVEDITDIEQRLDLWTGALTSRFKFDGKPVTVRTAVH